MLLALLLEVADAAGEALPLALLLAEGVGPAERLPLGDDVSERVGSDELLPLVEGVPLRLLDAERLAGPLALKVALPPTVVVCACGCCVMDGATGAAVMVSTASELATPPGAATLLAIAR